ncbi:hypothetical protein ABZ801_32290 [Actinomadura sp. NPDC047616]|uniref:hypothetical protein n=1 Tax=Actinomadura sp. NPDC047616 TaxID=3155914 RepID=UPI0033F19C37
MTFQSDTGALLDRARKYERQGRAEEAASAYARAADALEARADWFSAVAVRARHARALCDAGRTDEALRVLAAADRAASGLPLPASTEPRAVLDGQAAHVLAGAGRMDEAVGRAVRSVSGFRAVQDHRRADRVAVHAARLALKRSGPRAAVPVLRELLALLAPASDGHRQVAGMLADAERQPDRDHDILLADPDVPTWGRFAHAMAVGAHLAVGNGVAWNSVTDGRETREENRRLLADSSCWGGCCGSTTASSATGTRVP